MGLRKLERSIVKENARKNNESFENAWNDFRDKKYVVKDENKNIIKNNMPKNTQKKKYNFFDNKQQYFKMFAWAKSMKNKKEENTQ